MKTNLDRYNEYQMFLLKNGSFILITDVDPANKINNNENSRRCYCKVGKLHKKNDQFNKNGCILVIENAPDDVAVSIDISKNVIYSISELRNKEARYMGKLSQEKIAELQRIISDYTKTQNW